MARIRIRTTDKPFYRASDCPDCGGDVTRAEVGAYDRVTFWCARCQDRPD